MTDEAALWKEALDTTPYIKKDLWEMPVSPEWRLKEGIRWVPLNVMQEEIQSLHHLTEKIFEVVLSQQKNLTSLEEKFQKFQLQQEELPELKEWMRSQHKALSEWNKEQSMTPGTHTHG